MLNEIARVLRPGGSLGLDTPNARVCRLLQEEFVDPDHKVEYTVAELVEAVSAAGLEVAEVKGLNYMGAAAARGEYSADEVAANRGIFSAADDCYLTAVVARRT